MDGTIFGRMVTLEWSISWIHKLSGRFQFPSKLQKSSRLQSSTLSGLVFFPRKEDECHTKFVPETLRVPGVQSPRAQKGHVLLLLGHLDVPAAKLRTLSLPNKTTDCSTVCNTRPGRSPGRFSVPTSPCVVPNTARKFAFLQTIVRPLRLQ